MKLHPPKYLILINNSVEIEDILISEAMLPEAMAHPSLEICSDPFSLTVDEEGNLTTTF